MKRMFTAISLAKIFDKNYEKEVASQNTEIFVYIIYNSHNRRAVQTTDYTMLK